MRILFLCVLLAGLAVAAAGCGDEKKSTTKRTETRTTERTVESGPVLKGDKSH